MANGDVEAQIKALADRVEDSEDEIRNRLLEGSPTFFYFERKPGEYRGKIIASGTQKYIGENYPPNRYSHFIPIGT